MYFRVPNESDAAILQSLIDREKRKVERAKNSSLVPMVSETDHFIARVTRSGPGSNIEGIGVPGRTIDQEALGNNEQPGRLDIATERAEIYVIDDDVDPPELVELHQKEITLFNVHPLPGCGWMPVTLTKDGKYLAGSYDEIVDAKTDELITAGGSGLVTLWCNGSDSSVQVTAHYGWITPRDSILANENIRIRYNQHRAQFDIIDHDCED